MDKFIATLKALYLVPNTFQLWAWVLTVLVVLFLIKPTRRFGGIGVCVGVLSMFVYFAVTNAMKDFAPKQYTKEQTQTGSQRRAARPW